MITSVLSSTLMGYDAKIIKVEVDARPGLPRECIVGLPDIVVRESRDRIRSAIKNSKFLYPVNAYIINLSPAELRKEGPFFDLPIAVGILSATKQIEPMPEILCVGELSLNGDIRPVRGIISICQKAMASGIRKIVIPYGNLMEAELVKGIEIIPIKNLKQIVELPKIPKANGSKFFQHSKNYSIMPKFSEIKGQFAAKRAMEIAAAGHHNLLLIGPPGSGKTMLCKSLPALLPTLSNEEALEIYKIKSLLKIPNQKEALSLKRPFRNPHHTITYSGLMGGGAYPKPGEISLAHRGVLFLDELTEFPKRILDALRQPLEERSICIARANYKFTFPAHFMLVAAMNPCPCGYGSDIKMQCSCKENEKRMYLKKLSGPIFDRIDMIMEVPRLQKEDFFEQNTVVSRKAEEEGDSVMQRVICAREIQKKRFGLDQTNSEMRTKELRVHCKLSRDVQDMLGMAIDKGMLTGRSFDRVLKVARTVADLAGAESLTISHVSEALQYRSFLNVIP